MGKASRDKGKAGEREAAREIMVAWGVHAERGRQYQGGDDSPDVRVAVPGVHIEVKRVEAFALYPSLEQAGDEGGGSRPLVLHRRNRKPWVVVCLLHDLLPIAEAVLREKIKLRLYGDTSEVEGELF